MGSSPEDALEELKNQIPVKRSYMVYRANAIREVAGKKNVLKNISVPVETVEKDVEMTNVSDDTPDYKIKENDGPTAKIEFVCKRYAVKEDAGEVHVGVRRVGALDARLQVQYETA